MQLRFSVNHKINKKQDFDRCIRLGKCIKIKPFTCFVLHNTSPNNRLGVIISKKWHKLAVKRNQLRRWLKEEFRCIITDNCYDIVIIPYNRESISYLDVKYLWKTLKLRLKMG